eukprot:4452060-Ditylum_brightwellii.AAC.1
MGKTTEMKIILSDIPDDEGMNSSMMVASTEMSRASVSHRHGFKSRSDDRLWRCGVMAYVEEASVSAKPSGHSAYGMPHAIRTTEADLCVTRVKGRNGQVKLNRAYDNQYVLLPIWEGRLYTEP